MTEVSFTRLFAQALQGSPCEVVGYAEGVDPTGPAGEADAASPGDPLPVEEWRRPAQKSDLLVLDLCEGVTVDVGCGPGRMAAALAARGHDVLAMDVVPEAASSARSSTVAAVQADVFDALPHEGRWTTVLLADGNVGIGGDPAALLGRVRELLERRGRVVVDLAPPGVGLSTTWARLRCGDDISRPFRWSVVGADVIEELAAATGFELRTLQVTADDRWTAVLVRR
ncbi:class I SAM-dependent methyltransferase [Nocardioides zeae]|uniref:Class I SAM-dependent methyltransferase n=1 Tax=Nocardioides imazamoxiresistens TaxID=3231893 RepID=A0ABU3PR95_9ACTN|nr:class I SAM-dependent methyltransferase [Nocardioides zeae]MDT9591752.1 class I SAM-dependent methyltransferase [Nocardioides zeae]